MVTRYVLLLGKPWWWGCLDDDVDVVILVAILLSMMVVSDDDKDVDSDGDVVHVQSFASFKYTSHFFVLHTLSVCLQTFIIT